MSSFVANLLAGAKEMLMPAPQAQERFTKTPIYLDNLPSSGSYYRDPPTISVSNDAFGTSNSTLAHEAAHVIYDKANLKPVASQLLSSLPLDNKLFIRDSPIYNKMENAGSPEQFTDEGLGYLVNDPSKEAQNYYNNVSSFIKDPKLRETLNRIRNNALNARK